MKNMGRTLIGKEPVQEPKAPGRLSKVIAAPYKVNRACMTAAKRNIEKLSAVWTVYRNPQSAGHPF